MALSASGLRTVEQKFGGVVFRRDNPFLKAIDE